MSFLCLAMRPLTQSRKYPTLVIHSRISTGAGGVGLVGGFHITLLHKYGRQLAEAGVKV